MVREFDHPPVKRYSAAALPAYRFLPGDPSTPHPTEDPRGHSFTQIESESSAMPVCADAPDRWHQCDVYLYGCDLYNRAYWWEAHEAWEEIWQACQRHSAQYVFVQAMIQYAAAALKVRQNKPRGLDRLLHTADRHMQAAVDRGATDVYMGLAVKQWRHSIEAYYACLFAAEPLRHDARAFPYVRFTEPDADVERIA